MFDEQTTGFRWINGESDGWPGLVLDRYDRTLVLKLYTAAWLPRLEEIAGLITARLRPERIVLRLSRNIQEYAKRQFGKADGVILSGPPLEGPVTFLETGLRFEADVLHGQKTGFFLDQRENRRQVEALARGRAVLNAFSFSGGFSLYAARGGARSVTDLDLSAHALAGAKRNFALNATNASVASCRHELVQADAFEWLKQQPGRRFDLVILDPPSLAKREIERPGAIRAYGGLASSGIEHLGPRRDSGRLFVFGACDRGRVLWGCPQVRRGGRPQVRGIADHASCAGPSGDLQGSRLPEGDLLESLMKGTCRVRRAKIRLALHESARVWCLWK